MNSKKLRNWAFILHRYLGLAVGIILIIVGLTGSILVFQEEINHFLITLHYGQITPGQKQISLESVFDLVQTSYASLPNFELDSISLPLTPESPYIAWLHSPDEKHLGVLIDPYTGKILSTRQWEETFIGIIYQLHYSLLAGDLGIKVVGVVALLLLTLSITGIILWPGWRKLIAGFKIKWNASPKRVSFDLHKVVGIITAVFLSAIAFTGFCWNFYEISEPLIYAATFTPQPPVPTSTLIASKASLELTTILSKADLAMPGGITTDVTFPKTPQETFTVRKRFPQETSSYGHSFVYLDRYTGEIVQMQNALQPSRAGRILNAFYPLHFGTFGGLSTRILYVFVGLAPLILSVTGFIMYRDRL